MDNKQDDDMVSAAVVASKLRFSEIVQMLHDGRVEMDCDGVLVVANDEVQTSLREVSGCPMTRLEMVYRMAGSATIALVHGAVAGRPDAWEALGRWSAEGVIMERMNSIGNELGKEAQV